MKQCLERAKSERMRLLANARSQSMASETSVEQCLDGAELANIVRSAISIELSNVRDTAMECSDDQAQAHGAEDGLDHLSKDEYIDFMRALEEELYSELRLQGTKRAAFMPHAPCHILGISL